jgi:hypothetical protein
MLRFPKPPHAWADGLMLVFQQPAKRHRSFDAG